MLRGNRSGTYSAGCDRNNECQGGLCGVGHKYSPDGGLQPSRRYHEGYSDGGVQGHDAGIFKQLRLEKAKEKQIDSEEKEKEKQI